ncbi:hypothetical protein H6G04_04220 [Calothrix membranacea FACHB-236]|nr:hypothetical protein [Calothrix membranacea FACHB-236]
MIVKIVANKVLNRDLTAKPLAFLGAMKARQIRAWLFPYTRKIPLPGKEVG